MRQQAEKTLMMAKEVLADDEAEARRLGDRYSRLPLECDGLTRVLTHVFTKRDISHRVMLGEVTMGDKRFRPHFWIELKNPKRIVDYRARMWLGDSPDVPHGVFRSSSYPEAKYVGRQVRMPVSDLVFSVLTGERRKGRGNVSTSVHFFDKWFSSVKEVSSMNHEKIAENVAARAIEGMGMSWYNVTVMSRTEIIMALTSGLGLGRRASLLKEQLMVMREGSSNKFHYFALFDDRENERFVAGNAYGRIGYRPTVVLIAEGPNQLAVEGAYNRKARAKMAKGYKTQDIHQLRR